MAIDTPTRTAPINALVAVASGAAGAFLFLLAARGTWAGMLLSYLAPLPLMIATIGFGAAVGGAAVLVGGLAAGFMASPVTGLAVGAGLLLPAFLVCVAALRAPSTPPDDRRASRVVLVAMVFAAVSALVVVASLVLSHGGAANAREAITSAVLPLLRAVIRENRLPANISGEDLAHALVSIAPALVAASSFFMLVVNAYAAARVAFISGQIGQPWPHIADTLALPGIAAGAFAICAGLIFLGGLPGVVASILASALGGGFALVGLAVIHVLTRGLAIRTALLFALYAMILCLPPWPLFALALVGLVEAAFHLRRRKAEQLSRKAGSRTE